jgi:hypothetical protein
MALRVIGAGLGRTGTLSLKLALEQLGFGPCCHMVEVFPHRDKALAWAATVTQSAPDWDSLFEGFRATVDWPGVAYWRELADHYPEAKVILTLRDPARWYESARATIFNVEALGNSRSADPSVDLTALVFGMFDQRVTERDHCIDIFERHCRAVVESIPSNRLLQFRVSDGWEPLCDFLGCPVPEAPFPHVNEGSDFVEMVRDLLGNE